MNGGSNLQTQTQQAPSWQVPYQQEGLNQSLAQYQNPGNLVAPFAPQQEQAISGVTNLTQNGGPATQQAASNFVTNTLNNGPTSNPYLGQMFNQAAQATQNQLASQFAGSGRNVDQSQALAGQQLNNLATDIYGGAYNTGVQQQLGALQMANPVTQQAYQNYGNLFGAGQNVQNLAQQYIQAPQNSLNQYLSRTNGALGQTGTFNPACNAGAGALGGALAGGGLGQTIGSMFGGSGGSYGSLLGAIGGGLLGG